MVLNESITLEDVRITECIRQNDGGSTFLGYMYAVVVFALANGSTFKVGMPNLKLSITRAGDARIEFPGEEKEINGKTQFVADYFTGSNASRIDLTCLLFAREDVLDLVQKGLEVRDGTAGTRNEVPSFA